MKLVDGADVLVCALQSVITEPSTKSRDFHVNNKNASFSCGNYQKTRQKVCIIHAKVMYKC